MQPRSFVLVSCFVAAAGCDSSGSSIGGEAPTAAARTTMPVFVENTAAEPVPVAITGPLAVDVGTIPAVNLSGPVTIGNTTASPVPVRSVGEPVPTPWARSEFAISNPGGLGLTAGFYTVPAGKRLVIEYASASVWVPAGQRAHSIEIACLASGHFGQFYIPLDAIGSDYDGRARFGAAQTTKVYCDPATQVSFGFTRNGDAGTGTAYIAMSGYLVDVAP